MLAGFYAEPLTFAFPPAFMKEARIRVAAEWNRDDMIATRAAGRVRRAVARRPHHPPPPRRPTRRTAYETAFTDPACLKMILDWRGCA